jgi:hypothetical protein
MVDTNSARPDRAVQEIVKACIELYFAKRTQFPIVITEAYRYEFHVASSSSTTVARVFAFESQGKKSPTNCAVPAVLPPTLFKSRRRRRPIQGRR